MRVQIVSPVRQHAADGHLVGAANHAEVIACLISGSAVRTETGTDLEPVRNGHPQLCWIVRIYIDACLRRREELSGNADDIGPVHRKTKGIDLVGAQQVRVAESIGLGEVIKTQVWSGQQVMAQI